MDYTRFENRWYSPFIAHGTRVYRSLITKAGGGRASCRLNPGAHEGSRRSDLGTRVHQRRARGRHRLVFDMKTSRGFKEIKTTGGEPRREILGRSAHDTACSRSTGAGANVTAVDAKNRSEVIGTILALDAKPNCEGVAEGKGRRVT